MNKRIILAELAKIANELDKNNLFSEANDVTKVMNDVGKKKGGGGFFDQPGVMGGPRYDHIDQMMEQFGREDMHSGPFEDNDRNDIDARLDPFGEMNSTIESEEMVSSSMNAVVERSLDEDVVVRYPGPTGKRHIIEWNIKTPAWPGQEVEVDWEKNSLKRILDTDESQRMQNVLKMKSKNMSK